jgi:hypothetical protein
VNEAPENLGLSRDVQLKVQGKQHAANQGPEAPRGGSEHALSPWGWVTGGWRGAHDPPQGGGGHRFASAPPCRPPGGARAFQQVALGKGIGQDTRKTYPTPRHHQIEQDTCNNQRHLLSCFSITAIRHWEGGRPRDVTLQQAEDVRSHLFKPPAIVVLCVHVFCLI